MDKDFIDYFLLLEVHMLASEEAIKSSYKRLSSKYHPDNNGDIQKYVMIQKAYEVLKDHEKKEKYIEKWKKKYISNNTHQSQLFTSSIYDISFSSVKEIANQYMFFIMNKEYELAYECLSTKNKSMIFKTDFIKWQQLIGEVHELLEFDNIIETFNQSNHINRFVESDYKIITLRIRVVEMNLLLNRIEEDFFTRDMVYEDYMWKVLLPNIDIKNIIKKYKKILSINKKNKKLYHRKKIILVDHYLTKKISLESFVNNAEYEFLRFKRYNRVFSLISIKLNTEIISEAAILNIEQFIEKNTRNVDSYCMFNKKQYLILLPETNNEGSMVVVDKLSEFEVTFNIEVHISISSVTINKDYTSLKDMINCLITIE